MQELNKIQRLSNTSKADTLLKSKAFAYTGCAQKVFNFYQFRLLYTKAEWNTFSPSLVY